MPRRIDHEQRRAELAEAVWRLVLRSGVPAASVRAVAQEAGLSMGSLRYFFHTQDELLQFAMREVIDRAQARVAAGAADRRAAVGAGDPLGGVADLLAEVLPLDDERVIEARIWAAFSATASTDPAMAQLRREADLAVRGLCRRALEDLAGSAGLGAGRDLGLETQRLWALLDGLTMHLLVQPAYVEPAEASAVLRSHLGDLTAPSQAL